MHDDMALYDGARLAKLKELRKLMVELALEDENGQIDPAKVEEALAEAGETASEQSEMAGGVSDETAAEAVEEDPLAAARRNFFKPKKKDDRRPGTAMMIAVASKASPKKDKDAPKKGKSA